MPITYVKATKAKEKARLASIALDNELYVSPTWRLISMLEELKEHPREYYYYNIILAYDGDTPVGVSIKMEPHRKDGGTQHFMSRPNTDAKELLPIWQKCGKKKLVPLINAVVNMAKNNARTSLIL